ncbi:hypothetical protein [Nocardioides antri]|uniref:LppX_LprAFG lipoprotein n=1 Tax=Nocardioides antri TaxID=2607659 RepID=A0A5B1M2Y2_9ACTN|nr:hypothetical protein [Nocardioides antri]KAA1426986.1 hypothetical protein F0U47_11795 [Nocardioides antri]
MRRSLAGLALCAVLLPAVAACSDDEPSGPPALSEADRGEEVDVDAFLEALEQSFEDGSTATVTFDVRGRTTLKGRGVVRYAADGMDVDLRISDWQVEGAWVGLRAVGGATYMKIPESRGLWVDISAGEAELAGSVMEDADPRNQLDELREGIVEVRFSGDDTVAGAPARRYQVVTEPGTGAGEEGSSVPTVTEYWFDEDDRVVRRTNDLGGTGRATFTWSDWGGQVAIAPPPGDTVITLAQLERLRRQQTSRR